MSKMRLAVLLLAAWMMGAGAGRMAGRASPAIERAEQLLLPKEDAMNRLTLEMVALRKDLQNLREAAPPRSAAQRSAAPEKPAVLYQGKPASHWLVQFRDRDPSCRAKAVRPLAAIARADRSLVPVLLAGLQDDSQEVCKAIAEEVSGLKLPVQEAVSTLLHSALSAENLLYALHAVDPNKETTIAAAQSALQGRDSRIRRHAAFVFCDFNGSRAHLAIGALREAVRVNKERVPATLVPIPAASGTYGESVSESQAALALLASMGPAARDALPELVAAVVEAYPCFDLAALSRVDPAGSTAVPALLQALKKTRAKDYFARMRIVQALESFGVKARAAVPALKALLDEKMEPGPMLPASGPAGVVPPIEPEYWRSTILDALEQIDPQSAMKAGKGKSATAPPKVLNLYSPGEMAPPTKITPKSPR